MVDTPKAPSATMVLPPPYGPPAVHVARFSATALGSVTALTFFSFTSPGLDLQLGLRPVFTAALSAPDLEALRDVLDQIILAAKTMSADADKPQ
jgi:hypothetical protein